jgi:hypothetical protein
MITSSNQLSSAAPVLFHCARSLPFGRVWRSVFWGGVAVIQPNWLDAGTVEVRKWVLMYLIYVGWGDGKRSSPILKQTKNIKMLRKKIQIVSLLC